MTANRLERALWIMVLLSALIACISVYRQRITVLAGIPHLPTSPRRSLSPTVMVTPDTRDEVRRILAGDLFRREREALQPSAVLAPEQLTSKAPSQPKPRLSLNGLVGGPPWEAIVEGLPGHEGSYVVRAGDSVGGLKIRSVRHDGATIRGMDTTWVLKLEHTR